MTSPFVTGGVSVQVDGAELSPALQEMLESVVVDLAVGKPGAAVLRFTETRRAQEPLRVPDTVGASVRVALTVPDDRAFRPVFEGAITATEYEYDGTGAAVLLRCHGALHRLTRGVRTRSWVQVKDSDVVRQVLGEAGVPTGTVTTTTVQHEHVSQVAQTDWDFLAARVRGLGLVLVEEGRKASLVPLADPAAPAVDLVVGQSVSRLRVRLSSANQVAQVESRGWDPKTKQAVVGRAQPPAGGAASRAKGLPGLGKGAPRLSTTASSAVHVTALAQQRARSLAARTADVRADLEATCGGDPALAPRTRISLKGATEQHDGHYVLTRVQHVVDADGYRTRIESTGSEDRSLRALTGGGGPAGRVVPGLCVGLVTQIVDRSKGASVKLKLPWLSDDYETDWVRVCTPGAGPQRGLTWLPDVGDEVLVGFDAGDPGRPYVLGGLWNGKDAPPAAAATTDGKGVRLKRSLRSKQGHEVTLSDDPAALEVRVRTSKANELLLDDTGKKVGVVMPHAGGTVTVDSKGKVVVTGTQDVQLTSLSGRLLLEGKAGVVIKGAMVDIQAQGPVSVKGLPIRLN